MFSALSNQPPPRYEILREAGSEMCTVVFYTSVHTRAAPDGDAEYSSDVIALSVAWTDGLLADVRDNYHEWLSMAFEDENNQEEYI